MIKIAQGEFNYDSFVSANTLSQAERSILQKMEQGSSVFSYDAEYQLLFELRLRKSIIDAARALNASGMEFRVFRKVFCNEQYWRRTLEGGFDLRRDADPLEAIRDIYVNGHKYGTECATAMVIVYYKALADTLHQDLFREMFRNIYLMDWQRLDPQIGLRDFTQNVTYLPGDCRYFANPDVDPLTPEWQGENVIDLDYGYYYGHGMGITTASRIIAALNRRRKPGSETSAYLMDSARRPNFKRLAIRNYEYQPRWQPGSLSYRIL
jgi:protein-glutamine gamma-glutamyltransferase